MIPTQIPPMRVAGGCFPARGCPDTVFRSPALPTVEGVESEGFGFWSGPAGDALATTRPLSYQSTHPPSDYAPYTLASSPQGCGDTRNARLSWLPHRDC